ncbi:uncharacterized protein LOC62_03G003541 [Vanrija pseudolonga]|uniref:Uncharacterized protein n=1 Tax=Vanrija pseudolonga TaxID=143232 RepID=A0AAF0Y639_9TREE|nr:hypothetical protein LOC62_03G003541 [Vanrija pseudolonga]
MSHNNQSTDPVARPCRDMAAVVAWFEDYRTTNHNPQYTFIDITGYTLGRFVEHMFATGCTREQIACYVDLFVNIKYYQCYLQSRPFLQAFYRVSQ